ncbi:MAG TPA: ATP-dependent sacrificial sulfur transferase LarE [Candidatus Atribacteria bacterium]|nr:ATP-dependent sacrificial sulfur transferase LarE [Candidatus Atribacteria bacterium]
MDNIIKTKFDKLLQILHDLKNCLVAYSGGIDSTFLLFASHEVLGDKTSGILIDTLFLPKSEKCLALKTASQLNLPLIVQEINLLQYSSIIRNQPNRCYFCKKILFETIQEVANQKNFQFITEGSNTDDLNDFRPGIKAIQEMGIKSPLVDAGFTKEEIRQLSKEKNLPTWNKPSFSCLATRIPFGTTISSEHLDRIEKAELFLNQLGFDQFRVRDHYPIARIEILLSNKNFARIRDYRHQIVERLKSLGYQRVTLDLEGYRSGSMNEEPKIRELK